ncbi:hypothetical protein HMPREF0262_03200 [Clostridium sp. ATCC 29733]|nr:hypothetical protein HMPREF0262_03200 [Clostridium sp. ATCC 29733]
MPVYPQCQLLSNRKVVDSGPVQTVHWEKQRRKEAIFMSTGEAPKRDDPTPPPEPEEENYQSLGLGLGLCLGTAFGAVFHNLAIGISVGLCLGLAIGTAIKKKDPPGPTPPSEGGAEG